MASSPILSIVGVLNKLQEKFSSTASSSSTFDVPRLKQLNDMVYEVHSPQPGEKPELEVVFFHGLQVRRSEDAYVTTWMTRDNSQLWLQTWLVELFPKARIFTVSYDSSAKRTHESGRLDMYCTGENLVSSLTADEVRVGQAGCPVVLVGHCLGGLVLKELCLNAAWMLSRKSPERLQRVHNLFSNLRGMFFYATPHTGSMLGDELHVHFNGALLEEIQTMKASTARRNQEFDDLKSKCGWLTSGIGEVNETYVECLGRKFILMVPEASTRPYMDSYYSAAADHYDICKPQGKTDSALLHLTDFLKKIQEGGALRVMNDAQSHKDYYIDLKGRAIQVTEMLAQPNVRTIFITGLSGIGKSALAQEVFHNMRHNFPVTCFISLDNIDVPSNDHVKMWQKIQYSLEEVNVQSISDRYTLLRYLKSKNVLMVVDNVHSEQQWKALEISTWLEGTNSKLIVTTTNTRLGTSSNTSLAYFQVPYLNDEESHHLFSKYAFENGEVPRYLKPLITGVITKCENFPLSLKILGSYASKEDVHNPRLWQELMARMDKAVDVESGPDYRLWATLRICFEALKPSEQELFLDVATFFHDVPFSLVECIWDGCAEDPFTSWNNLKKRFLANEGKHGKIQMHSQLRVLGQSIACGRTTNVDKWSRVYKTKDARELIAKHQPGVENARGLKLQSEEHERLFLAETTFDPYLQLRYLMLEGVEITGKNVKLPTSLVYLRWTNSLFEICPVDFTNLENLVAMDLKNCKSMKTLPSGLGNVKKLKWLGLEGCVSLTKPCSILSKFRHLKHLELSNAGDLGTSATQMMTKGLKQVCKLRHLVSLDLSKTKVSAIPEAISNLQFLTTLIARHTNLTSLPESIGELIKLETLDLNYTPLEKLPDSIGDLGKLRVCRLGATKVSTLPNTIGNLLQLEILIVSGTVSKVPDTFRKLKRLKEYQGRLTFHDSSIEHLAQLEFLGSLSLDLRDLGEESPRATIDGRSQVAICSLLCPLFSLHALTKLTLWGRDYAQSVLPQLFCALQKIPCLQELHLRNFLSAEIMPYELGGLTKLKRLMIWECDKLKELPESLGNLSNLTLLYLKDLPRLSRLPESLAALSSLSDLYIMECESLQSMPSSFGHMSSLQRNEFATPASDCPSHSQLQSLRLCTSSWSLSECFLECYGGQHALLYVQCEEMEKVMKKVSRNREGVLHVLGPKAAVELFREMELSRRERENGLREDPRPFAPHPSWRHCIAFQFFVICCVDPSEYYTNDYCHVHSKWVGVMDNEEESDTDTETEEDEADSETGEDKVDSEMGEDKLLTATSVMMLALLFASKIFLTYQRNREELAVRTSVHKFYTLIFRICFVFHRRKLEVRRGRR